MNCGSPICVLIFSNKSSNSNKHNLRTTLAKPTRLHSNYLSTNSIPSGKDQKQTLLWWHSILIDDFDRLDSKPHCRYLKTPNLAVHDPYH